jgi:hypothetical protein
MNILAPRMRSFQTDPEIKKVNKYKSTQKVLITFLKFMETLSSGILKEIMEGRLGAKCLPKAYML